MTTPDWIEGPPEPPDAEQWYEVRAIELWRWLPYKPVGREQMRKSGRWQRHNGYGFENADWPEGAQHIAVKAPKS